MLQSQIQLVQRLRAVVLAALFGQRAVELVGELQPGQADFHLFRTLQRDAHILDEVLDVEAGREIALQGEILRAFAQLKIPVGEGNVVFPSGNALKYLSEYFDPDVAESSPYDEDPNDIRTVSVCANGDVLNGNLYKTDVLAILRAYQSQNA